MEAIGSGAVCLRCGSLRTRVLAGGLIERLIALAFRQDVIACGRCGFRGRQSKSGGGQKGAVRRRAEGGHRTIDLAGLDRALDPKAAGTRVTTGDK